MTRRTREPSISRTVSTDGIHSFVAGFPLEDGSQPGASESGANSKLLPVDFSILMKPVPVYKSRRVKWKHGLETQLAS